MFKIIIIPMLTILTACQYPSPATITQLDDRPTLQIKNAPEGAVLYVDGIENSAYDISSFESKALLIEKGSHEVCIIDRDGNTIYSKKIFVGPSSRKIINL